MPEDKWWLYMLRTRDGALYTGIARDVERRIQQHENGPRGARSLRSRGPFVLEYSVALPTRSDALRLEYWVKKLPKREKEALVLAQPTPELLLREFVSSESIPR